MRRSERQNEATLDALANLGKPPRPMAYKLPKRRVRDPLARWMRKREWNMSRYSNNWRHHVLDLVADRHPWWDWGHKLMIVVGQDQGGNWSSPEPPTWYYRLGPAKRMWHTGYPRHPLSTFEVITDYSAFRERTAGMNEDQLYEWSAINTNQDGDLHLGHQYWGQQFYGLNHWEVALLRRYLRKWHRLDWYGARSWLYSLALNAAVDRKRPGACNVTPPRGSGGYSHWHCEAKRRHAGDHRFGNYIWPGGTARVEYVGDKR